MIPSQFSLDHRLAELRPTAAQLRLARDLRDATDAPSGRSPAGPATPPLDGGRVPTPRSRLATS